MVGMRADLSILTFCFAQKNSTGRMVKTDPILTENLSQIGGCGFF